MNEHSRTRLATAAIALLVFDDSLTRLHLPNELFALLHVLTHVATVRLNDTGTVNVR
jgi:hypothetical protein